MAAETLRAIGGSASAGVERNTASARFERGELTVEEYLELLVDESVALVGSKLPAARVEWLRGMLREQLTADPVLRERVRQATGRDLQVK